MARKEINNHAAEMMMDDDAAMTGTELATTQPNAVVLGTMNVEADFDTIQLPRLQITYGVGKLAENFSPGDIVLGGDNLVAHKNEPVKIIILCIDEFWKEYFNNEMFEAGLKPRVYHNRDQVLAAGGTVDWVAGQAPTFSKALDLKILIRQPEGLSCGLFAVDLPDGHRYAPAILTLDKQAYAKTGPGLVTVCSFALGGKLLSGLFTLQTQLVKGAKNIVPIPMIKLDPERNSQDVQDTITGMFAG